MVRPASTTDDATPNPNGIAAQNLIRLAAFTGDHAFREKADRLIEGVLALGGDNLFAHVALLNAIDMRLNLAEIVVTGEGSRMRCSRPRWRCLISTARCCARRPPTRCPRRIRRRKRSRPRREPAAFICVGETCSLPVTTPEAIAQAYDAARGAA